MSHFFKFNANLVMFTTINIYETILNKYYVHHILNICIYTGMTATTKFLLCHTRQHLNLAVVTSSSKNLLQACMKPVVTMSWKYSGTPLIRPPTGQNKVVVLTGWLYYWGRVIFRSKHVLINVYFKHIRA